MIGRVHPHFLFDARDGARELLATSFGRPSERGGNGLPGKPLATKLGDLQLFLAQPFADRLEQFADGHDLARSFIGGVGEDVPRLRPIDPAHVATPSLVKPNLFGQFVPGHADEQVNQLPRLLQVKLADRGSDEKAGQNRLTYVRRVEHALKVGITQPQPRSNFQADLALLKLDEFLGRGFVPFPNPADEVRVAVGVQGFAHRVHLPA